MPITPDTKDWTWVLERPCLECGFDASLVDADEVAELIRENAAAWPYVLDRDDAAGRPDDETWSPLEYAAHVRDVHRVYRTRVQLMLAGDDPLYPNWDQDVTAVEERYDQQDPATVGRELVEAAERIAEVFDSVAGAQWQRRGRRSDGAAFTVDTIARYYLHDVQHHLHDVQG
ncbi:MULTISPECIES: DinB family protein [unclassified Rathayibacter]|uniref:DinB family protein n=1 Tax=unclassified Rathayibacter TaxID=2609250 RepID=UPI000CE7EFB0|nr:MULTISPECIES: DinB family protein [unclassified Rathayibacter]PPH17682.1 methyltransferase type 12 [Rathayibacter sp. AY1F8]PPH77512.1 methyltransferase type 12 [Rathayibacter sp. AY1D4]PPH91857.1 methyltransferase type 12 [Rathayibacter sp. AY1D3]